MEGVKKLYIQEIVYFVDLGGLSQFVLLYEKNISLKPFRNNQGVTKKSFTLGLGPQIMMFHAFRSGSAVGGWQKPIT